MITDWFTNTMKVEKKTSSRDSSGGATQTWSTRQDNIACRIEDASANERYRYKKLDMVITHRVFTQYAGTTKGDRLYIAADTIYIRVQSVEKRREIGSMEDFYVIMGEEIKPTD